MRAWFLILLLFLLPLVSLCQLPDYHVQVFNETYGIRNFNIRSVVRDQKDFIWILYDNRIQRFDGKHVKEFYVADGMFSIICDAANRIWCTSRNQVYRYKNDFDGFVSIGINDSVFRPVGYVFELSDHRIYLNTEKTFYVFNEQQNSFIPFTVLQNKKVPINTIKMGTWGSTFFFAAADSLFSYNTSTGVLKRLRGRIPFAINAINDHKILFSDWSFTSFWVDFEEKTMKPVHAGNLFQPGENKYFFTNDLVVLDENNFLITTQKGLLRYNNQKDEFKKMILFHEGHMLEDMESLTSLFMDSKRNIWASFDQGLIYFQADNENLGLMRNAFPGNDKLKWNNDVRKFAEDEKGNIWFVTVNGFNYWDLSDGSITHFTGKINNKEFLFPSIRGVTYNDNYLVLGPTKYGIWLYDPLHNKFRKPNYSNDSNARLLRKKIEGEFINHMELLKNGDHLITGKDGLYILSAKTYHLNELQIREKNANCIFSYQDSKARIWIGTRHHLHCYDSSYHFLFTAPDIGDGWARCIWENNDHQFYVGSNGLFSIDINSKPFIVKKVNTYFDHSMINFLFKDKRNRVWIGSDNGLFLYDMNENKIRSFDYSNNLQGKGFYNQGAFLSSKGILYIGGSNGINYFRPEDINIENEKLQPAILNMAVNDDDSSFLQKTLSLQLAHTSNSIRFDFVAPYFNNASRIQYRYCLSGLDDKWKYVQNNTSVYITSLAPGDYNFKVAATIDGSDWYESEIIHFTIKPPFWKTWWFYLACIIITAGIIYAIYRYRIKQILKMQNVRNRISSELHDDIGSRLTNINILTSLTRHSIQEPVQASTHLQRISEEVQTSAEALDDIVWSINTIHDSFEEVIARMRRYASEVLSGQTVIFNTELPEAIHHVKFSMEKRHDIYLLFKEVINNIHKHAGSTEVSIMIRIHHASFDMHISDNGKGFDANQPNSRNGLSNLRSRAEKWHGSLNIESSPELGTNIKVRLPV